jgi:Na+/H+ antiporter NhaC
LIRIAKLATLPVIIILMLMLMGCFAVSALAINIQMDLPVILVQQAA